MGVIRLNGVVGTSAQGVASTDFQAGVQTVSALQAIDENSRADKQIRLLEDKGNSYRFDSTSTATTDGDEVIRPDDVSSDSSAGRWVKIVGLGGDVVGPASSTDNSIARYSGTGGKTVQGSTVYVDDSGNLGVGTSSPGDYPDEKNNLVIREDANVGMSIISSGTGVASIAFGMDTSHTNKGWIDYNNNSKQMRLGTNGNNTAVTIDSEQRLGLGIDSPSDYVDEKNNFVLGATTGHAGMTIVTGNTSVGTIQFRGDTSVNNNEGWIDYNQNSQQMRFGTNGLNTALTISSAQKATFAGDVDVTGGLSFDDGTAVTSIDTDISSVSGSDDTLASAKAIKTYVDAQVTDQDLDITTEDGTSTGIDLDSETLTISGGEGIDTSATGNTVTIAAEEATDSNKGVASFAAADFSVS